MRNSSWFNYKMGDTDECEEEQEDQEEVEDMNGEIKVYEEPVGSKPNPKGFFAETKSEKAWSVWVAVRVRPLIGRELVVHENVCVECKERENMVVIGKDKGFVFDRVFDQDSDQEELYDVWVKNLILGWFEGYNATVLAYGQTGSGKTYTMGTTELAGLNQEEYGIVPRVIKFVFDEIEARKNKAEFIVKWTFLEIYNEELHDLLDPATCMTTESMTQYMIQKNQKEITIREEKDGQISVYGLQEEKIESPYDLFSWLERGSNFRSTSSTLMNSCSSRSHAIFTITIEQHIVEDLYKANEIPIEGKSEKLNDDDLNTREEFMVAKFHFVDLAGSERLKKTGATGTTMKEGISINKGLLSLGNVISALTDDNNRVFHVPYRDSKLTRILQDSLGGNSRTTMIWCISPAEYNYEESLNALKYAARARNIKNKPIVNRDPNSALIAQLRQNVYELQRDIIVYK